MTTSYSMLSVHSLPPSLFPQTLIRTKAYPQSPPPVTAFRSSTGHPEYIGSGPWGRSRLASRIRQRRQNSQPFTASTQPSFGSPEVWLSRHSGGQAHQPSQTSSFFGTEYGVIETKIDRDITGERRWTALAKPSGSGVWREETGE